jgi:SAM-dependent methyltransferase
MSVQALREFINRHNASAAGLAALAALLDTKVNGVALERPLEDRLRDLLAALDGGEQLLDVTSDEAKPFLAELRAMHAIESKLLYPSTRAIGWNHTEPELLQAVGDVSAGFVQPLAKAVVPNLSGLSERLAAPTAAFLDVGVGVAGLAIAAARTWPAMRVVGIDPWQPSLAIARENVAREGLSDRIELREQRAEDLPDDRTFDLAWVATNFMPASALRPAAERIHRALRPGGWVLFNATNPAFDPRAGALWRLRMTLFGDGVPASAAAEILLKDAGFAEVRTLPSPPGTFICVVAAQRAP